MGAASGREKRKKNDIHIRKKQEKKIKRSKKQSLLRSKSLVCIFFSVFLFLEHQPDFKARGGRPKAAQQSAVVCQGLWHHTTPTSLHSRQGACGGCEAKGRGGGKNGQSGGGIAIGNGDCDCRIPR